MSKTKSEVQPCCCPHCGHCTKNAVTIIQPYVQPYVVQPYRPQPYYWPVTINEWTISTSGSYPLAQTTCLNSNFDHYENTALLQGETP